jgi:hypothetical protein
LRCAFSINSSWNCAHRRYTASQDLGFTRRKSPPVQPSGAAAASRANRKSPPLSSPTSRRTVRKLSREDCPAISRNNDESFNDFDHDDHGDGDDDEDEDDDDGSMPDLQETSPYDSSDSEDDDDNAADYGSMPDLQERSPYCGDSRMYCRIVTGSMGGQCLGGVSNIINMDS